MQLRTAMIKIIIMSLLFIPSMLYAVCGGTTTINGNEYTAYDTSRDCVALAISDAEAAGYGKTVKIPAGTGTGYTTTITVTKDMRIVGAGTGSTFIDIDIAGPDVAVFTLSPISDNQTITNLGPDGTGVFDITGITFTGTYKTNVDLLKVNYYSALWEEATIIKRIRVYNNELRYVHHIIGGEWGFSHGVVYNNVLWNSRLYYAGASNWSVLNLIHPGDGLGWYFEDNIVEGSTPYVRRATNNTGVKFNAFDYYIAHTKYSKTATDNVALPSGTVPQGTYAIYRFSINADGTFTITPGDNNFTTGYASASAALAALPALPADSVNMGYGYVMKSDGDFINGTTALNASGVTSTIGSFDFPGSPALGGGNNSGAGIVLRYNKLTGGGAAIQEYIDVHSNQLNISGGQLLEVYGNDMLATNSAGTVNRGIYTRGQKNIYLYNRQASNAAGNGNAINIVEEWNDHYSHYTGTVDSPTFLSLPAELCTSRIAYNGEKQACPGYTIGNPDSCYCWKVHDSYFLNNRYNTGGDIWRIRHGDWDRFALENTTVNNEPPEVVENVEWFNHVDPVSFDGSAGISCGTLAEMNALSPTTVGVGFWVPANIDTMPCISLSTDNLKQTAGVAPVTPITGTLYKWDGIAWVAYWSPYTYPHPLRSSITISGVSISGGSISGGSIH